MDFNSAFAQKYSIMQQQANNQGLLERANANNTDEQAKQVAANAAAARGLQAAQAGRISTESSLLPGQTAADIATKQAQANQMDVQSRLAPQLAQSSIGLQGTQAADNMARAGLAQAQIPLTYEQTNAARSDNRMGGGLSAVNAAGDLYQYGRTLKPPGQYNVDTSNVNWNAVPLHAAGISKIPGKGDGTVDKVPAILAPGEAVLNKGAAEHVGRGLIDHLNAVGAAKMGMAAPPQKLAKGTSKVAAKGKGPAITPEMLQMLMQPQGAAPQGAPQQGAPAQGGGLMAALQQNPGMV